MSFELSTSLTAHSTVAAEERQAKIIFEYRICALAETSGEFEMLQ